MKTKLFSCFLTFLILLGIESTKAQVRFAPTVGVNFSVMSGKTANSIDFKSKFIMGFQAGVLADITFAETFFFQPGLVFNQKGTKKVADLSGTKVTVEARMNWIEVPLNVGYRLDAGFGKVNLFAGPYLGFGINGKKKTIQEITGLGEQTKDEDIEFGNKDKGNLKGFDFGANIGAGVEINGIAVNATFGVGLPNLRIEDFDGKEVAKNNRIGLSVAYFF